MSYLGLQEMHLLYEFEKTYLKVKGSYEEYTAYEREFIDL